MAAGAGVLFDSSAFFLSFFAFFPVIITMFFSRTIKVCSLTRMFDPRYLNNGYIFPCHHKFLYEFIVLFIITSLKCFSCHKTKENQLHVKEFIET